jgi:uncharacterized protein (AIM24 family)
MGNTTTLAIDVPPHSQVLVEHDCVLLMDPTLDLQLKSNIMTGLLTNQSKIQTRVVSNDTSGTVTLAPKSYGDIKVVSITDHGPLSIMKSSFLAASNTVNISVEAQGIMKAVFSGGVFIMRATGKGIVAVHGSGSLMRKRIRPGETMKINNGFVVAWTENCSYTMVKASSGMFTSLFSGVGMMCLFSGDGYVYYQTRPSIEHIVRPIVSSMIASRRNNM